VSDAVDRTSRLDRQLLGSAPFNRFRSIQRLGRDRSGHASVEHVRHQLYTGRDKATNIDALIKVTTKPGVIYEHNLTNEIAALSRVNRELPDCRYFPLLLDHGRLADGRVFVVMSLFAEWPLATTIGPERRPDRLVVHLRTTLEVATALADLHRIPIFHVDLNPMNILYRLEKGRPVIRIVDFESSYEVARHANGVFYNPPTTAGFCAPEVQDRAPDARVDVYSLGAVLYTIVAGYEWTWQPELSASIEADAQLDDDLRAILLTATAPDADSRYQSIQDMYAALAAYLESIWPGRSWA
jgi:serine/threonine protein kinase